MASATDVAEEDLELYGEPVPESPSNENKEQVEAESGDNSAPHETESQQPLNNDDIQRADFTHAPLKNALPSENGSKVVEENAEADILPTEAQRSEQGQQVDGRNDNSNSSDAAAEDVIKEKSVEYASQEEKQTEEQESGNQPEVGKDEEGGDADDDEDEEDEEDESDDDDFDVILNVDEADVASRPMNTSFGSIGKVRLGTNKWQRPGYVPPERVIGNASQGAARTGGLLSMLPTPTLQVGNAQKSVYDLEIGKLTEKPWLDAKADMTDYFNYGFTEETWKLYCERQKQMRLEVSMKAKIKTVDGNKNQATIPPRNVNPNAGKPPMNQQHANRNRMGAPDQMGGGVNNKHAHQPGMLHGMMGLPTHGSMQPMMGVPNMPNMRNPPDRMTGLPQNMHQFAPFNPKDGNPNGRGYAGPIPGYPFMPGNQPNENMFMYHGMPNFGAMGLPNAIPQPGMGRGDPANRGFPGQMNMNPGQPPQDKLNKISPVRHMGQDDGQNMDGRRRSGQGHPNSRFSNAQGGQGKSHQGRHDHDRRQRWGDNRGHMDRRQDFDRHGNDGGHGQGRRGYDDRGYGDRNQDRRRWNDNRDEGYDNNRRRGGNYDGPGRSDNRRDYDRDRDRGRDYRKRQSSSRDFDDDRKRARR